MTTFQILLFFPFHLEGPPQVAQRYACLPVFYQDGEQEETSVGRGGEGSTRECIVGPVVVERTH